MSAGAALASAAATLVGTRFRLYGREPASGLDCVGMVSAALTMIGRRPLAIGGYSLRNRNVDRWFTEAARSGLSPVAGALKAGDVLLICPAPLQHHLMIVEGLDWLIHAHAALRRVVREPLTGMAPIAHWRP